MAESQCGNGDDCQSFSCGTDCDTEGWWYHGCSLRDAKAIRDGKQVWRGKDERCFTRDPRGADQEHGPVVIRAMVHVNKPPDIYFFDDSDITGGYLWIKLYDASRIMFDRDYLGCSKTGEELDE